MNLGKASKNKGGTPIQEIQVKSTANEYTETCYVTRSRRDPSSKAEPQTSSTREHTAGAGGELEESVWVGHGRAPGIDPGMLSKTMSY